MQLLGDSFPIHINYIEENIFECKSNRDTFNIDSVLNEIQKGSIKDSILIACCYHQIAIQYDYYILDHLKSINYNKKAKAIRIKINDGLLWTSYRNLGINYYNIDYYKEAKKYFEKSVLEKEKVNTDEKKSIEIYRNLSDCNLLLGDFDAALSNIEKALSINTNEVEQIATYNIYSLILIDSNDSLNVTKSIDISNIALNLIRNCKESDSIIALNEIIALNNIANAYDFLENFDVAIKYNKKAIKMATSDTLQLAAFYNNIANVQSSKTKYNESIKTIETALVLYKTYLESPTNYWYSAPYENLADNYADLQQFDTTLLYYQKALINLTNNFRTEDIHQNPNPNDTKLFIYSNPDVIRVLHLKATAAHQYYQQNNNPKYLNLANQTYQTAFDFHDQLQKDISTENSRLFQVKNIVPYIENALKVAYDLQQSGQTIGESAFRFMEKNKATVLLQSINEADALQFANLPDSLLEQEKDLKIAISFYAQQLNEARLYEDTITVINELENTLFENKEQYGRLINNLELNYSDYHHLKYQQNQTQLTDIQNQLNLKTAILEYFVGDSSIFILSIQKENSKLYKFQKPNEWDMVVSKFLSTFNIDSINKYYKDDHDPILFNDFTINSTQLFESLLAQPLKDLGDKITSLQIIPDAKLNYIPFELLLTNNNFPKGKVNYKNLPYLIIEKTISYAYSAALLLEGKDNTETFYKYQYAGFAPNYENNELYDSLPATKGNVIDISKMLNGIPFVENKAIESNFRDTIQQCKIFQFAGHGDIDDENPLNSKLVFTKTNNIKDYELHAFELYNLEIPAQLGVLSACETGLGKTAKGEGIMSLSRAFTYAGCNSLVMSLWSIYDVQTADIVERFFAHLKKGKAKDEALRQAKLDYLLNPKTKAGFTHPIYWAGLVQIGDTSPLIFDDNFYYWLLLIAIVLLLAVSLLLFKE